MKRKFVLAGLLLLTALIMAFLLRDVVELLIIRPLLFLFWLLDVIYLYIPQPVLWLALILGMLYLFFFRLVNWLDEMAVPAPRTKAHINGPVADLAFQIGYKDAGVYFKWLVAHYVSRLALDIQELRQHVHSRQLRFNENRVSEQVRLYLDRGLNSSFSDYPLKRGASLSGIFPFLKKSKSVQSTPFDGNISPVIDYLENEMGDQ